MYAFVEVWSREGADARRWFVWMWLAWGLAFMTKGPPGLLPLLAMTLLLAMHDRARLRRMYLPAGILVFLVVKFVGPSPKREPLSGLQVTWRTILAGVLTPILMVVGAAPSRVGPTSDGNYTVQRTLVTILLVILWLVGLFLVAEATRKTWNGTLGGVTSPRFAQIYPALYLGVHVALWLVALPAFLNAKDGFTSDGAPIGSGWYSIACILASGWFVIAALRATKVAAEQAIPAPATAS